MMTTRRIDSPNPDIGPQWDDLIRRASSNVFMNPAALKAASETDFAAIKVLLAWQHGAGERKLVGIWALQLRVNDRTPEAADSAFESFLALEKASWKGAQGTALLSDSMTRPLSGGCLFQRLAARQDASVALLRVDGQAIAARVLMYCGTTAYTWKTAFNAEYGKYSPGALLIDRITEELFAGPDVLAINSCAAEASFMAQLWAGRRAMADMLIDVGPGKSLGFRRLEAKRLLAYQRLRGWRDWLRGRRFAPTPRKLGVVSPQ